jgi:hypothetical protein
MASQSMKVMGKEVGSASLYAKPHTMSGGSVTVEANPGKEPNRSKLETMDVSLGQFSKSA